MVVTKLHLIIYYNLQSNFQANEKCHIFYRFMSFNILSKNCKTGTHRVLPFSV